MRGLVNAQDNLSCLLVLSFFNLLLQPSLALEHFGTKGKAATANEQGQNELDCFHVHKVTVFGSMSKSFFIIFLLDKLQESQL